MMFERLKEIFFSSGENVEPLKPSGTHTHTRISSNCKTGDGKETELEGLIPTLWPANT